MTSPTFSNGGDASLVVMAAGDMYVIASSSADAVTNVQFSVTP